MYGCAYRCRSTKYRAELIRTKMVLPKPSSRVYGSTRRIHSANDDNSGTLDKCPIHRHKTRLRTKQASHRYVKRFLFLSTMLSESEPGKAGDLIMSRSQSPLFARVCTDNKQYSTSVNSTVRGIPVSPNRVEFAHYGYMPRCLAAHLIGYSDHKADDALALACLSARHVYTEMIWLGAPLHLQLGKNAIGLQHGQIAFLNVLDGAASSLRGQSLVTDTLSPTADLDSPCQRHGNFQFLAQNPNRELDTFLSVVLASISLEFL